MDLFRNSSKQLQCKAYGLVANLCRSSETEKEFFYTEVEVGSATINKSFLLGHPDPRKTQGFPDWSLDFISNEVSV